MIPALRPGDLLIVVPLRRPFVMPRFTKSSIAGLITSLFFRAVHVAMYTGTVIEQSFAKGVQCIRVDTFVKELQGTYRQFWVYVVRPRNLLPVHVTRILSQAQAYSTMPYNLVHALRLPWIAAQWRKLTEPITPKGAAICSSFAAFVLKKAGVDIGRRSSAAFTPRTFLHSNKFKVVRRVFFDESSFLQDVNKS